MLFKRKKAPTRIEKLRVAVWPRHSWSRSTRYLSKRVLRLTATPHVIAIGFAAGAFASFTPFIGLHFLISFALAYLLGGNIIASAFGTAIGNPLTFPLIWASTYKIGNWILSGGPHHPHHDKLEIELHHGMFSRSLDTILPLIKPMLVGAVPLGLISATASYFIVLKGVEVYQRRRRNVLERKNQFRSGAVGEQTQD